MDPNVFPSVFIRAQEMGRIAHAAAAPTPMTVTDGRQSWYVADGACGFAWVKVYGVKLNTKLGKVMAAHGFKKSYSGGIDFWISTPDQSVARKEAYARAFADVLRENGLDAYMDSRLD